MRVIFRAAGIFLVATLMAAPCLWAMGKKPGGRTATDYGPEPVTRGSAANPNAAFRPPRFDDLRNTEGDTEAAQDETGPRYPRSRSPRAVGTYNVPATPSGSSAPSSLPAVPKPPPPLKPPTPSQTNTSEPPLPADVGGQ